MKKLLSRPRRRGVPSALLAAVVAAALFAGGAFAARADYGDPDFVDPQPVAEPSPADMPASTLPAREPAFQGGGPGVGFSPGWAPYGMPVPVMPSGCPAPIGVAPGVNGLDLAARGFALGLPGPGFVLLSMSIRSEGPCDAQGQAGQGALVVDTAWRHAASGRELHLSQRAAAAPAPNVRHPGSATFSVPGYVYSLNAGGWRIMPASASVPSGVMADPATQPGATAPSPALPPDVKPGIYPPPPQDDPQAESVIDQAIAALAPSLGPGCFYRQARGGWADLPRLGLGDPRPALPAGFRETAVSVEYYNPPSAACGSSVLEQGGSLSASFALDGASRGQIYISASPVYPGGYPGGAGSGSIDDHGAYWSNSRWTFSIGGDVRGAGIGVATLTAMARALDPSFSLACLVQGRSLQESELAAFGMHAAKAPAGWSLVSSSLVVREVSAACPDGAQRPAPHLELRWQFSLGADAIDASANRVPEKGAGMPKGGSIGPNFLNWSDGQGTFYSVNAHSRGVSPAVSQDALIAVAKSMDPTLDVASLHDVPDGGGIPPMPMPRPVDLPEKPIGG